MDHSNVNSWEKGIGLAEWWYNTTYRSSIKMSPFQALYGYPPLYFLDTVDIDTPSADLETFLEERQQINRYLKQTCLTTQNKMK